MIDLENRLRAALARPGGASSDFDLNPDAVLPAGRKLRAAGVLMAVMLDRAQPDIVLTKRSSALKHHPGQIAFPGGKQDPEDVDAVACALREAHEEIGLPLDAAEVLGTMPPHETVTGFQVTPVLALVHAPFDVLAEEGEVEEVFRVPLDHVLNSQNYSVQGRTWKGHRRRYFTVPYGPYYIWGATARMLRALASRVEG